MRTRPGAVLVLLAVCITAEAQTLDLTKATIVAPAGLSRPEKKAVAMLVEEVQKRTQLQWPVSVSWPASGAVIAVGTEASLSSVAGARLKGSPAGLPGAEGY